MKQETLDDPVIYEADVHFAPKRKGDFYLFQFSHNSSPFSVKRQCLGSIKSKPKSNQFEIELLMNTQSTTFDHDKSKRIAFNVDDNLKQHHLLNDEQDEPEKFFPNNQMNKQILNSEKLSSTGFQFALAYLRQDLNEIKLIPIKSILDFKPTFRYLDKVKIKTSNKKEEDSEEDDEKPDPKPQTTKKVTMRYEDERKKPMNNKEEIINENWKDIGYFDYGISKFEREKNVILYKINEDENEINLEDEKKNATFDNTKFSYQEFAFNSDIFDEKDSNKSKYDEIKLDLLNTIPFYQTSNLLLKDQIRSILCSSKVISFNKCVELLKLNIEKNRLINLNNNSNNKKNNQINSQEKLNLELVIKYLEQYAQLVRGNWVVKSDIIYPKNVNNSNFFDINSIPFTNISIDMLCKARDYVLYKFTKQESLSRLELIEQVRVPPNVISEILEQFSIFNKQTRSWDFINAKDNDFLINFKDTCKKQEMLWESYYSIHLHNLFG